MFKAGFNIGTNDIFLSIATWQVLKTFFKVIFIVFLRE